MENFKVVIEHDCFSRKPIYITFKYSLVDNSTGEVLHAETFKHRSLEFGLYQARVFKRTFLQAPVILGLQATDVSKKMGFKVDVTREPDQFMEQIFENASVEFLEEYLLRTNNQTDIESIKNELEKRGVLV